MHPFRDRLKTSYGFGDTLFYTCLLAVPMLTGLLAIYRHSLGWTIAFLVLAVALVGLMVRFYCTRCPHYAGSDATVKCIFFWGLPKVFAPRTGPYENRDLLVTALASAALVLFPLFWLLKEPGLLLIYLLSLAGFGAAIYRNECRRCIHFQCPINRVPEERKRAAEEV